MLGDELTNNSRWMGVQQYKSVSEYMTKMIQSRQKVHPERDRALSSQQPAPPFTFAIIPSRRILEIAFAFVVKNTSVTTSLLASFVSVMSDCRDEDVSRSWRRGHCWQAIRGFAWISFPNPKKRSPTAKKKKEGLRAFFFSSSRLFLRGKVARGKVRMLMWNPRQQQLLSGCENSKQAPFFISIFTKPASETIAVIYILCKKLENKKGSPSTWRLSKPE